MKFVIITLLTLFAVSHCIRMGLQKGDGQTAANALASAHFQSDLEKIWEKIFKEPERKSCGNVKVNATLAEKQIVEVDGIRAAVPSPKPDFYSKLEIGFGKSAYFFDYIDEALLDDIVKEFKAIHTTIMGYPRESKEYEDPYTLNKMLSIPLLNSPPKAELLEKMQKAKPDFDAASWEASASAPQIRQAIKENKWDVPVGIIDPAKRLIDKFDFDGDGRLNTHELLISIIDLNRAIIGSRKCKLCFDDITQSHIDPIYQFADLNNNDKLGAEEIWKSFEHLKRSSNKYNIYICRVDGQPVRTSSVNDFILKSHRTMNGSLSKQEFRIGLLIGFWGRQTQGNTIFENDSKSRKGDRWSNPDSAEDSCIN